MGEHFTKTDWAFVGTVLASCLHWAPAVIGVLWGLLKLANEWDEFKKRRYFRRRGGRR
jgi:hypothetical protein